MVKVIIEVRRATEKNAIVGIEKKNTFARLSPRKGTANSTKKRTLGVLGNTADALVPVYWKIVSWGVCFMGGRKNNCADKKTP